MCGGAVTHHGVTATVTTGAVTENELAPVVDRLPFGLDCPMTTHSLVSGVDDDESVRESLEVLIRSAGWQPETFAPAEAFLSCPRRVTPSCLVLDVSLPDLNGLDLQQHVVYDRPDVPIIFITGYGDVPMTVRAMKADSLTVLVNMAARLRVTAMRKTTENVKRILRENFGRD